MNKSNSIIIYLASHERAIHRETRRIEIYSPGTGGMGIGIGIGIRFGRRCVGEVMRNKHTIARTELLASFFRGLPLISLIKLEFRKASMSACGFCARPGHVSGRGRGTHLTAVSS